MRDIPRCPRRTRKGGDAQQHSTALQRRLTESCSVCCRFLCPDCNRPFATIGALGGHKRFCDQGAWRCEWCEVKHKECSGKGPGKQQAAARSTQQAASSHAAALTTHLTPSLPSQGQAGRRLCARRAAADGGMAPLAPLNRMTMGRMSVRHAAGGSSRWALYLDTSAPVIRASGHANGASARSMNAMRRGRGQAARRRYAHRAARDGSKARPDRLSAMRMVNTYARRARRSSTRSVPWAVIGASATLVSGGVDGATAWLRSAMVRAPVQKGRRRCAQRALRDSVRGIPPRHYGTTAATSYAIRARRPSLLWGHLAAIAASARSSRTPLRHA